VRRRKKVLYHCHLATHLAGTAFKWMAEKAEDSLAREGKVVTADKDSAVLLGLRKRVKKFLPLQVDIFSEIPGNLQYHYNRKCAKNWDRNKTETMLRCETSLWRDGKVIFVISLENSKSLRYFLWTLSEETLLRPRIDLSMTRLNQHETQTWPR